MKKQTGKKQWLISAAVAAIILFGTSASIFAQKGIGAKYGDARDPQACGILTGAAPSQQTAMKSFICHAEGEFGNNLYLVDSVAIQVGRGRAYNMNEDINVPNIDTSKMVYPVRGSFHQYQCSLVPGSLYTKDHNCTIYDSPNAQGLCYKNTWDDWICKMADTNSKIIRQEAAPPNGAGNAPTNAAKTPPARDDNAASANNAAVEKDPGKPAEAGYPKPDFSEMEKWFDIVRYEYGDLATDPKLYFWVKPKTSDAPFTTFCMQFFDKDGVMIDNADPVCGNGIHIDIPSAGQVTKAYTGTPSEAHMDRVVSVKVYRIKR